MCNQHNNNNSNYYYYYIIININRHYITMLLHCCAAEPFLDHITTERLRRGRFKESKKGSIENE